MGQADLQIGEAAIGEGAEMIGLVFDGGAEIGDGAVIQLEADVGQATPIQHLVIAQIEPQSGVVIADGALEKALARIGDAAVEIGAEIFRIEFDGAFELDDRAVVEALVVIGEAPVVIDEHQVVGRQAAVFYGLAVKPDGFVEFTRALRLERVARIVESVGVNRERRSHEGNSDQ